MATGTATIDFGAFPGASDASVVITGQASIVAGSLVEAWIRPADTADHTSDEHLVETIRVVAHSIVASTGFTISAFNTGQLNEPLEGPMTRSGTSGRLAPANQNLPCCGGTGTRLYGVWSVAWAWS